MSPMPRFPPRGPLGRLFPRFNGTMERSDSPPSIPPPFLRSVGGTCPAPSSCGSLPESSGARAPGPGLFLVRLPYPVAAGGGDGGVSQVPGEPLPTCQCSWTPAASGARPSRHQSVAFRYVNDVGTATITISGLYHTARRLAVYASSAGSPRTAQDSLPTGGQPWLGGTFTRWVPS